MSDLSTRHGNTARAQNKLCTDVALRGVMFFRRQPHTHPPPPSCGDTHLVPLNLGQCEPAEDLLRLKRRKGVERDDCEGESGETLRTDPFLLPHFGIVLQVFWTLTLFHANPSEAKMTKKKEKKKKCLVSSNG